jgi:hypothetical protein
VDPNALLPEIYRTVVVSGRSTEVKERKFHEQLAKELELTQVLEHWQQQRQQ